MFSFKASLAPGDADRNLEKILSPNLDSTILRKSIQRMRRIYAAAAASCPPPWPAPNLVVTPEIHYQSELWLPLAEIAPVFERFYCSALTYPPILSSTPFSDAASWAAIVAEMPPSFGHAGDPAALLERLLTDCHLRKRFLCWSFMPRRFYGGAMNRYPGQWEFLLEYLGKFRQKAACLRCLDAASGNGAGVYGLARLLLECGWSPQSFQIQGWTLDPMEAWAAAHAAFPHDPLHQRNFRQWAAPLFSCSAENSLMFNQTDLLRLPQSVNRFDIILCNGLLGGPIINQLQQIDRIVNNLAGLLEPGGLLLAADQFHGGWKKSIPGEILGDAFRKCGLEVMTAGEGIGGLKPD